MRFSDMQTKGYSVHATLRGLFDMLCSDYCECGQGYDILDKKDGILKCQNCWRRNNINDNVSAIEMMEYIKGCKYGIKHSD